MHPNDFSGTQQGANILGILQMVKEQQEGWFLPLGSKGQTLFQSDVGVWTYFQHHTLVISLAQLTIESLPFSTLHGNTGSFRQANDLGNDPNLLHATRNVQAIEATAPCP
jgi:hypothetical protein